MGLIMLAQISSVAAYDTIFNMIHFYNVSKRYPHGQTGLANVTFHIARGEMAFVTGHSGAGKSTLLKLIMMLERTSQGQLTVAGKNLISLPNHHIFSLRRQIGIVMQNPYLINHRSVFDNVVLPLELAGIPMRERPSRVRAALDKVGLLNKEKLMPNMLSLGEQQRVGIARAIVNKPPILLADEPTGNLDPELSTEIFELFAEFNRVGTTVLLATHNLAQIASMPYRIIMLKQGHLINAG